jgi:hypothetical protein
MRISLSYTVNVYTGSGMINLIYGQENEGGEAAKICKGLGMINLMS